jgi:hypothetical protein
MTQKTLVLGFFDNELEADAAAAALRSSGAADRDAIGVLALDANGALKEEKVGARSIGKGAGVGAALFLLGPGAVGVGLIGGAAVGALHHKGLQLDGSDRARITSELQNGRAAVGVLARGIDVAPVSARLTDLGGTPESHDVSDEQALAKPEADGSVGG